MSLPQAQRLERATSLRGQLETEASLRQQLEDLQASSASLQEDNAALQVPSHARLPTETSSCLCTRSAPCRTWCTASPHGRSTPAQSSGSSLVSMHMGW